ncbi:allatotropins-like [Parasteatoda tepidariorum]|uniref:allatotropins-like n=1 Tax=Parasteatoda tepidariorum TaxID=114398 RepID=UPI0039BC8D7D
MSRLTLVLFCVLVTLCSCAPRQKRGFRNAALSTARGFGKRIPPHTSEGLEDLSSDLRSMSSSLLAEQIARNPGFAQLLMEKVIDRNSKSLTDF